MDLTRELVEAKAEEYAAEEPLYAVEVEQIETFGDAVAAGDFGWRDAEWVVQWCYRRYLGAFPDRRRRALEAAYGENDFGAVRDALEAALDAAGPADAVGRLTGLSGVDVPVASAFLLFLRPASYIVVGDREWTVLHAAGEIDAPFSEPVAVADYEAYLDRCRSVGERFDCSMWTLYRAFWRLWKAADA